MRAAVLVRTGKVSNAFEIREISIPECSDNFVCIAVEAFGLNFADVMARKGQYRDAPPIPSVLGYDVCGRIVAVGKNVSLHKVGDRVTALTRFGGYAEFAVTEERAAVKINDDADACASLALATQGATAWYCAEEVCSLYENERVLITAAAGGVGFPTGADGQDAQHQSIRHCKQRSQRKAGDGFGRAWNPEPFKRRYI